MSKPRGRRVQLKVDILPFNGNLGIEDFIDYVVEIERLFDYIGISGDRQVEHVANQLKDGASA